MVYGHPITVEFEMGGAFPGEDFAVTLYETNGLENIMIAVYSDSNRRRCVRNEITSNHLGNAVVNLDTGTYWFVSHIPDGTYVDRYANYFGTFTVESTNITVEYEMEIIPDNRMVSIASGNILWRFPRELGEFELWQYDAGSQINCVCCDNQLNTYIALANGHVRKIDGDGNLVWSYTGTSQEDEPEALRVVVDKNYDVYCITKARIHKIDGDSGSHVWRVTETQNTRLIALNIAYGSEIVPTQWVYYTKHRTSTTGAPAGTVTMIRFPVNGDHGDRVVQHTFAMTSPYTGHNPYYGWRSGNYIQAQSPGYQYVYYAPTKMSFASDVALPREVVRMARRRLLISGINYSTNNTGGAQVIDFDEGGSGYRLGAKLVDGSSFACAANPEGWVYASMPNNRVRLRRPNNTTQQTRSLGATIRSLAISCGTIDAFPENWGYAEGPL